MIESILKRRSIRKYKDKPIPLRDVEKILEAAMYAPSSKNGRPWHFFVVEDEALKEKLGEAKPYASHAAEAPVVVVLAADMDRAGRWIEDLSIAASHIMLQATEMGYGTCMVQVRGAKHDGEDAEEYVRKIVGVPENFRVGSMVAIGFPAEEKEPHAKEKFEEKRIHWRK